MKEKKESGWNDDELDLEELEDLKIEQHDQTVEGKTEEVKLENEEAPIEITNKKENTSEEKDPIKELTP